MSEKNYLNETVVPRMPKSVSNEQLFVFVPVASGAVAGILKINSTDFYLNRLPELKIIESGTLDSTNKPYYNPLGYVRAGIIKAYVDAADEALQDKIDLKQDKNLSKTIAEATTVEGALINLDSSTKDLKTRMTKAEGDINTLKTVVGDTNSGLVKKVNDNAKAISDNKQATDGAIGALQSQLNTTNENLNTTNGNVAALGTNKQDKAINIPGITAKTVEGALTELDGESSAHAESIRNLTAADEGLANRVNNLEQSAYGGETPIGTYPSGSTLPTQEQLTAFVQQEVSRAPKLGDVVLFTQTIYNDTDKSYKFMYTATGWSNYVIPTVESASNLNKGILQGTVYDTTGDLQVSILEGKITDILVKDGTTYKSIKTLLDSLVTKINTAQNTADNVIKKYNNVEFTLVSSTDTTMDKFPCKYTANIEGVTINNVADVYFSALQIPLEIFSSYVQVEDGKVSIVATGSTNYPTSVTVPTVRIS